MKILGRKKKKEEEEELDEEEDLKEKPVKTRKPKEKVERKKKPPKPWGKRERYILLVFLGITVIPSAILALSSRSWKLPGLPRINLPSFDLGKINFLSESTIVIEANPQNPQKAQSAISAIKDITRNLTGVYGVYVLNLDDGFSYGVNEDESFEPASLNKLSVMYTAYAASVSGEIDLDTKHTLRNTDKIAGSGVLSSRSEGSVYTYQELLDLMGKKSDNTAFDIMRQVLGEEKINLTIEKLGLTKTSLAGNKTTPSDVGNLFKHLYEGYMLDDRSKWVFLQSITNTDFEDWVVSGVPETVEVSHKFGREVNVVNDAGIVFAKSPYVTVILSKGIVTNEANSALPAISHQIYEIETSLTY